MSVDAVAVTPRYRVRRATSTSRVFAIVFVVGVAVLADLPAWGSPSLMRKLVELFVLVALAQMWNLLAGYAGLVSIGQQAFVGLGAYGLIVFANNLGWNVYVAVAPAAVAAAVLAVPIGLLAFRLRGGYFAVGTWVIAEVVALVVANNSAVGGGSGVSLQVGGYDIVTRQRTTYWLALALGVSAVLIAYVVLRSRLGLALQAIRSSEAGASGLGANVYAAKFAVYVIAALWTGLAGAVYYLANLRVQPTAAFSVATWTAPVIFIVVIGGLGTIEGPIVGAIVYYVLRDRFADYATWYLMGLGVLSIIAAVWVRRGLWGTVAHRFGIRLFPVQRRVTRTGPPVSR
ncbi:MAG TPA: branched-chain amino acid ABC transporter permease [Acidimicrobiales bacterium]